MNEAQIRKCMVWRGRLQFFRPVRPPFPPKLWISLDSFGRIGAFQWVMTNPNKKIRRTLNSPPGLCSPKDPARHFFACFSGSWSAIFRQREETTIHFYLFKEHAGLLSR
jgi:hypothetical protein